MILTMGTFTAGHFTFGSCLYGLECYFSGQSESEAVHLFIGGDAPHEVEFKIRDVGSQVMAEGFASALQY